MAAGTVASMCGQEVSVASDGQLVYGTGSERSTLVVPTGGSGSAATDRATGVDGEPAQETSSDASSAAVDADGSSETRPGVLQATGNGVERTSSSVRIVLGSAGVAVMFYIMS